MVPIENIPVQNPQTATDDPKLLQDTSVDMTNAKRRVENLQTKLEEKRSLRDEKRVYADNTYDMDERRELKDEMEGLANEIEDLKEDLRVEMHLYEQGKQAFWDAGGEC